MNKTTDTPKPNSTRDTRIDFFRGIALITIFINHVPKTFYEHFTSRNFGFSDAAEAFVFLSGMSAAFAYGKYFKTGQRTIISFKAIRRAGVLYSAHITSTVVALGVFSAGALLLDRPLLLVNTNIAPIVNQTADAFIGMATLGHQIGYFNILPMYSVILLFTPIGLWLALRNLNLMLGVSLAFWALCMSQKINIPAYPNPGGWFFNPLAWQALFFIGLYIGMRRQQNNPIKCNPYIFWLAAAYLVFALLYVQVPFWGLLNKLGFPWYIGGFDKTYLTPPRLLHLVALAYVVINIPWLMRVSRVKISNPIAVLGQNALPVFVSGSVLSILLQAIKTRTDEHLVLDTLLIAAGLCIQYWIAKLFLWIKTAKIEKVK